MRVFKSSWCQLAELKPIISSDPYLSKATSLCSLIPTWACILEDIPTLHHLPISTNLKKYLLRLSATTSLIGIWELLRGWLCMNRMVGRSWPSSKCAFSIGEHHVINYWSWIASDFTTHSSTSLWAKYIMWFYIGKQNLAETYILHRKNINVCL